MGFLSRLFGAKKDGSSPQVKVSASVHAGMLEITRTDDQVQMLRNGYKENFDNEIFTPDTVWAGPRSKVYHYLDCCCGTVLAEALPIPESEALRRGLHRCKKCDWRGAPVPIPGEKPVGISKPVSRSAVKPVR